MSTTTNATPAPYRQATAEDVRIILGNLEDAVIMDVLSSAPSLRDLNDAALSWRGDGDLIAREHRELSAKAQSIVEILADLDDEEPTPGL